MTEKLIGEKGVNQCPVCSGQLSPVSVKTITSASATTCVRMNPGSFREWLMDEVRDPDL